MSDDPFSAHMRTMYGPVRGDERTPAPAPNAGTPAPSAPRIVHGPNRSFVPTGETVGPVGKWNRIAGSYKTQAEARAALLGGAPISEIHPHLRRANPEPKSNDGRRPVSGAQGNPTASEDAVGDAEQPPDVVEQAEALMAIDGVPEAVMPHMQVLHAAMTELQEPPESMEAMKGWLGEFAAGRLPETAEPHGYDVSKWHREFQGYERSVFESFARAMAAAGVSEAAMDNMTRTFLELRRSKETGKIGRAMVNARRKAGK